MSEPGESLEESLKYALQGVDSDYEYHSSDDDEDVESPARGTGTDTDALHLLHELASTGSNSTQLIPARESQVYESGKRDVDQQELGENGEAYLLELDATLNNPSPRIKDPLVSSLDHGTSIATEEAAFTQRSWSGAQPRLTTELEGSLMGSPTWDGSEITTFDDRLLLDDDGLEGPIEAIRIIHTQSAQLDSGTIASPPPEDNVISHISVSVEPPPRVEEIFTSEMLDLPHVNTEEPPLPSAEIPRTRSRRKTKPTIMQYDSAPSVPATAGVQSNHSPVAAPQKRKPVVTPTDRSESGPEPEERTKKIKLSNKEYSKRNRERKKQEMAKLQATLDKLENEKSALERDETQLKCSLECYVREDKARAGSASLGSRIARDLRELCPTVRVVPDDGKVETEANETTTSFTPNDGRVSRDALRTLPHITNGATKPRSRKPSQDPERSITGKRSNKEASKRNREKKKAERMEIETKIDDLGLEVSKLRDQNLNLQKKLEQHATEDSIRHLLSSKQYWPWLRGVAANIQNREIEQVIIAKWLFVACMSEQDFITYVGGNEGRIVKEDIQWNPKLKLMKYYFTFTITEIHGRMRNFRGPLPRCLGSDDEGPSDEDDDGLNLIYMNHENLLFSDDSEDDFDETDRFAFNLIFNQHFHPNDDEDAEVASEDQEDSDDEIIFQPDEIDATELDGPTVAEEELSGNVDQETVSDSTPVGQDYAIELEVDGNGGVECSLIDPTSMEREDRAGVILSQGENGSPSVHVVQVESEPVSENVDVDMNRTPQQSNPAPEYPTHHNDGNDSDGSFHQSPRKPESERCASAAATESDVEDEDVEDRDQFCNPMASDSDDDEDQSEILLRGDRIGSTTYSERHVLKILLSWIEKLPKAASDEEASEDLDKPLEQDFEDAMALLWDMSAETDVIHFIMSHNILTLIRDTIDTNKCPTRLKEVALGILANILSCQSVLESFPEKDEEFRLVERVVMEAVTCTKIPLLIQAFAVLRRVVCYIRNAKPLERWMELLLHEGFISAANFLLASSTNGILLGDVIMTLFALMEVLSPPHDTDDIAEEEKQVVEATMAEKFKPFCQSEFVPSLCEGLNELLKDSRSLSKRLSINPPTDPTKLPNCGTTGNGPDEYDYDVAPPGHVQSAVLNGIGSLAYLHKFEAGRNLLTRHSSTVTSVLTTMLDKFKFCTERVESPEMLDYFALAVDLLGSCLSHTEEKLKPEQVLVPASATMWLIDEAAKQKQTHIVHVGTESSSIDVELDSSKVSPYAIIFFNFILTLKGTFGDHAVEEILTNANHRYKRFYDNVLQVAHHFEDGRSLGDE